MSGPASGIPAHGTRPPFQPGHLLSLKGGYRSARVYGELAEQLAAGLVADRPDLAAYPEEVAAWASAEAQVVLFRRHLESVGPLDDSGEPRNGLLNWMHKLEKLAREGRDRLGLDPRSEASLARERAAASVLAVDLEAVAQRGREVLSVRQEPAPDLAGRVLEQMNEESQRAHEATVAAWREEEQQHGKR